jgi:hypothetical protein
VRLAGGAIGVGLALGVVSPVRRERDRAPVVLINGTPRLKQTDSGAVQRWPSDAEVTVAVDQSLDALGAGAREAVMNAFGTWLSTGARLPELRFDVRDPAPPNFERDGVNSVVYAPIRIQGHTQDVAITISFADAKTGRLSEKDIVLNSAKPLGVLNGMEPARH